MAGGATHKCLINNNNRLKSAALAGVNGPFFPSSPRKWLCGGGGGCGGWRERERRSVFSLFYSQMKDSELIVGVIRYVLD